MDRPFKVIIAEDNYATQDILANLLEPLKTFEVIELVDNGESLINKTVDTNPDIIITDIHMPKTNGIDAINSCLKINPNVKFIFITGYSEYAVKAFELNAVDYILKPVKKERLYSALDKAKLLMKDGTEVRKKILQIKMNRNSYFIPFSKIIFIEKDNRKTIIHTKNQLYETNEPLDGIMQKLDSDFFRSHRSFILNIHQVSHVTVEGEAYSAHFFDYPYISYVSKIRINELYKELNS